MRLNQQLTVKNNVYINTYYTALHPLFDFLQTYFIKFHVSRIPKRNISCDQSTKIQDDKWYQNSILSQAVQQN